MMNQGQAQNATEQMGAADQAAADQQAQQDAAEGMNQDQAENANDQQAADQAAADQQAEQGAANGMDQAAADQQVCFNTQISYQNDLLTLPGCSGCQAEPGCYGSSRSWPARGCHGS